MKPTVAVLYSDTAGAALVHALKAWRKQHAPSHSYEGLIGGPIRSCKIQTTLHRMEAFIVHVRIEGKARGTDEDYYYEATLAGGEVKLEHWSD